MQYRNIQHLRRHQVDTSKWDQCVANAVNGLLYAHSFYLDHMADNWDALVLGDYEAVMPLTWRMKFGIKYLCQPFTTPHLGIFSLRPVDKQLMEAFVNRIPGRFKLIDIDLNEGNNFLNGPTITQRRNYVLPLTSPYLTLYENYNRHARRKLRKAGEAGLQLAEGISIESIAALSYNMMLEKEYVPKGEYEKFIRLFKNIQPHVEACNTMAAIDSTGNMIASDAYIVYKQRVYSLLAGNRQQANECGGFYFVLDNLIKKYAGTGYVFDFEGSDVPGIAFVFECLGAQLTWYPHLAINNLPLVLRWFKRSDYE